MSMSKKARMSTPADDEEQALVRKHGRPLCDDMAGSLKKKGGAGYKHVHLDRTKGRYKASVIDIDSGKQVHLGYFNSSYAAAVTAALSEEKGKLDKRDAALTVDSLQPKEAKKLAKAEGLTLVKSTKSGTGYENVHLQESLSASNVRPFRISSRMYNTMPSSVSREYVSAEHAALEIARHMPK